MVTFSNSEDPDEMPQTATFQQCLHCLLRQNHLQGKKNDILFYKSYM